MTPTMTKPTTSGRRAGVLTRADLMVVTAREAAVRLGGYDSPAQVAVEHGLAPSATTVPVVDLGAHAGELGHGDEPIDLGGFTVVSRGSR